MASAPPAERTTFLSELLAKWPIVIFVIGLSAAAVRVDARTEHTISRVDKAEATLATVPERLARIETSQEAMKTTLDRILSNQEKGR
jgi:hypothetical protein